ncbi:hypothetical protein HJ581_0041510 [Rhodococcus opacus]|uniref:hypothetical protein n=1 Tax=Rhodococcus opacus TaxID=37919 RepID=UPI00146F41FB|nr:hypothetical protein [Rhodococcus opacus]MDV7088960.1 hypothetical protein [Rhodococcus opacus]WKN60246.1 hypothetical protein HJ581_0041510 [Rhodococcus opacus]
MRVTIRNEKPHPGAQLRFTDIDGLRLTAFITNSTRGELAERPDQPFRPPGNTPWTDTVETVLDRLAAFANAMR